MTNAQKEWRPMAIEASPMVKFMKPYVLDTQRISGITRYMSKTTSMGSNGIYDLCMHFFSEL